MKVQAGAVTITLELPETTGCSDSFFCKKITSACTAVQSYVSDRVDAITHPTKKGFMAMINRLYISAPASLFISMAYLYLTEDVKFNETLTKEQGKIFAICMFGICLPVITLLVDVICYVKDRR